MCGGGEGGERGGEGQRPGGASQFIGGLAWLGSTASPCLVTLAEREREREERERERERERGERERERERRERERERGAASSWTLLAALHQDGGVHRCTLRAQPLGDGWWREAL